jgi:hypothetical protein
MAEVAAFDALSIRVLPFKRLREPGHANGACGHSFSPHSQKIV